MQRMLALVIFIAGSVSLYSCSKPGVIKAGDTITVGTFNVEWLGDGSDDDKIQRSEEDYKNLAAVIEESGADVLGLEEVENPAALQRVLKYLNGYSFYVGSSARQQNVGVLYKNTVQVSNPVEYMPVATRPNRNRPGFVVQCKKGNFDWIMMVVHFKSSSRADSTPELKKEAVLNRIEQAEVVAKWVDSLLANGKEKDIMIVGDFNDSPIRRVNPTLMPMMNDSNIVFLTKELGSCQSASWMSIDHIVCTQQTVKRWQPISLHHINFHASLPKEQAKKVSDHCPVVGQFETLTPDED